MTNQPPSLRYNDIIEQLAATLIERKSADPQESYVAALYAKGLNKILEKVGEESVEFIIAAKDFATSDTGDDAARQALTGEAADLLFHLCVALTDQGIDFAEVAQVLQQRVGISGHAEKAQR